MEHHYDKITERLLETPYWVIDLLPRQVPQDSRGQFFAVEQYYLTGERHERLCRQFAGVVLGLNCYHDLTVNRGGDEWVKNPEPEVLVAWLTETLQHGHLCALIDDGDSLITASGGIIMAVIKESSCRTNRHSIATPASIPCAWKSRNSWG